MKALRIALILFAASAFVFEANAQTFGIELHNSMMPASGAMAGVSISRPQDLQSAIYGNPATLTQFRGTQFSFGAGWAEPTINIDQSTPLPLVGVDPYSARSGTPGSAVPNIGVTQDMRVFDFPVTIGLGLMTNAGLGVDYRRVPESNGTSAQYLALDVVTGVGVDLTERLSVGAAMTVGTSFLDGPFVDLTGMTAAFALRGTIGANYNLGHCTSLGTYWQTKKSFDFEDAVLFGGLPAQDLAFDHPENFGIGIANNSLSDGRLLLATDIVYKHHSDADFLKSIYKNQWVYQFGAQYAASQRLRLRVGYAYNENPMRQDNLVTSIGGVSLPDGIPALRYVQGQFAAISQHRITGGVGIRDMLPGIDVDLFAGGMFENTDQFAGTRASVESYWVGGAITWRFRRGSGQCLQTPCEWN